MISENIASNKKLGFKNFNYLSISTTIKAKSFYNTIIKYVLINECFRIVRIIIFCSV